MSLLSVFEQLVATAATQVLSWRGPQDADKTAIRFTSQFRSLSKARGLTEHDALDVYHHGTAIGRNLLVRTYNGYELGIYYFVRPETGQTVITSIWKRDRR